MTRVSTAQDSTFSTTSFGEPTYQSHYVAADSVGGYKRVGRDTGAKLQARQPTGAQAARAPSRGRAPTPQDRYALNSHLTDAVEHAREMEEAAAAEDPMELASAGVQLHRTLAELWRLRHLRSDDWAAVINFLQAMMAQREFEQFTFAQCTAVREILTRHLAVDCDAADVSSVIRILRHAGFNPWRGVSHAEDEPDADVEGLR